ncbi:MAG: tetratricopeptide repeat protein, partial [Pontiellaceae bacterium]|nr:tetratricopeptide repeat protein [Pontiellaceae bacterium]
MRFMKRGTGVILSMLILAGTQVQAQTTGELLQQGLYAEEIEGNLPEAIVSYEKIVNDASASPKHKAQALYHQGICYIRLDDEASAQTALSRLVADYADQTAVVEKAKPLLDKIKIFDPAALMPADTLVYLELGNIGGQIETIFEILKGT